MTPGAVAILQQNLPTLMVSSPKIFAEQFLEMISLMSKRWVQIEWPTLLPVRSAINQSLLTLGADLLPVIRLTKCDKLRVRGAEEAVQEVQVHVPVGQPLHGDELCDREPVAAPAPAGDQLHRGVQGADHEHRHLADLPADHQLGAAHRPVDPLAGGAPRLI